MFFPFHDDNPTTRTPVVTVALIAVNAVVFVWSLTLSPLDQRSLHAQYGFTPARIAQFADPNAAAIQVPIGVRQAGPFLQQQIVVELKPDRPQIALSMLTCMFLHGGWFHLIGNMWFLWVFGNNVEERLGGGLYLVFYLLGGVLASGCHWVFQPNSLLPVIGASGAVATVLGAYAVTWPWARVHTLVFLFIFVTIIDLPALLVLGVWFIGQVLSGTQAQPGAAANVAWWAHIGGFLAGMLLMPVLESWVHPDRPPGPRGPTGPRRPFDPQDAPRNDPPWPRDRIIDVRLKDH